MGRLLQEAPEFTRESVRPSRWTSRPPPIRRRLLLTLIVLTGAALLGLALLARNWPFSRSKVISDLEEAIGGRVEIGKFYQTWFPHPGCVAENVTFTAYGNLPDPTPITIRKLVVQGSLHGLLTKHVPILRAEGVHVIAPNASYLSGWQQKKSNSNVTVEQFFVTNSVLEFGHAGADSLKFGISEFKLSQPDARGVMRFETALQNSEPPAQVRASGNLGPWKADDPKQTPISGSYSLQHGNLGAFHGIAGDLSSDGSFQGTVEQIEVRGKTVTPDFEVTDTGHKIPLVTEFQASISTKAGDVALKPVIARLGRSGVESEGAIAQTGGQTGKTASLDLLLRAGRIQDFLFLFLNDKDAPMTGKFSFKGRTTLPPGQQPFTEKVRLEGDFGIDTAHLTNPATQSNLDRLSKRAEGEKDDPPERVVSDLKGHVLLRGGTATFSNLSFHVPGAKAKMHGTYNLVTHRINLHGTLLLKADLPKATSGVKSFLLKIINPFLKKNHHGGAVFPVSVTGIYPNPVYKTDPI